MTTTPPAPELEFTDGGQVYSFVRTEPYRRRDGTETELRVYRSGCARCHEPFEVKVSAGGHRSLNRRCPKHHRPGSRVRCAAA